LEIVIIDKHTGARRHGTLTSEISSLFIVEMLNFALLKERVKSCPLMSFTQQVHRKTHVSTDVYLIRSYYLP